LTILLAAPHRLQRHLISPQFPNTFGGTPLTCRNQALNHRDRPREALIGAASGNQNHDGHQAAHKLG